MKTGRLIKDLKTFYADLRKDFDDQAEKKPQISKLSILFNSLRFGIIIVLVSLMIIFFDLVLIIMPGLYKEND